MSLFDEIKTLEEYGHNKKTPQYIIDNLSTKIKLREYQKKAFEYTLTYVSHKKWENKQKHLLYNMATGSGKTIIMAMNILYYYNMGYRNFLFFTNQSNILSKTKQNLLPNYSTKFLFNKSININGNNVEIKKVNNFFESDKNAINICFNTIQSIHSNFSFVKENSLTIDDFKNNRVILLADEAHHFNSKTYKDQEDNLTWEDTIEKIYKANKENVLLEFTATCNLKDENVAKKYNDKIIFDYNLKNFRQEGYTKEFVNMRSNSSKWGKTLQALVVSQYRKLLFEKNNVSIKPVILLKSKTIADSTKFYEECVEKIRKLSSNELEEIKSSNLNNEIFNNAFKFFEQINMDLNDLVNLIKLDFSVENYINMNSLTPELENKINNLDEVNNKFRLIFTVDKLTEGWDVLSLFDIVRLFETRQGGSKGTNSKYTISEAQLIGRGARYYPFKFSELQEREKRKYSNEKTSLSICETLLYHCMDDSIYITEIKKALKETGLIPEQEFTEITYKLKDSFKKTNIYLNGLVFLNKQYVVSRNQIKSLPEKIRMQNIIHKCETNKSIEYNLFDETTEINNEYYLLDPISFCEIQYAIRYKAYRSFETTLSFNKLKKQFPNLKSVEDFLTLEEYLGLILITFQVSKTHPHPSIKEKLIACKKVMQKISDYIPTIEIQYAGTKEFEGKPIKEIFTDKIRNITKDNNGWGIGVSQNDDFVDDQYKMDLSTKDWYVYNDNHGTTEEKKFVKYFSSFITNAKEKFDNIFLIRNEAKACIYSFKSGSKFEPDYILILEKDLWKNKDLYICVFVEPKGEHLLEKDLWKNEFLLELTEISQPIVEIADEKNYKIWGTPLYNDSVTKKEFHNYFVDLLKEI